MSEKRQGSELLSSIADLYRVFDMYQRWTYHGVFSISSTLFKRDLHELSCMDLQEVVHESWIGKMSLRTFKRFLPRVFELVAGPSSLPWDRDIAFKRLASDIHDRQGGKGPRGRGFNWREWPEAERNAVNRFALAWWSDVLSRYPSDDVTANGCLVSIGQAWDDMSELLDIWRRSKAVSAQCHLVEFIEWNYSSIMEKSCLMDCFWDGRPKQMQQVIKWILSAETSIQLEAISSRVDSILDDETLSANAAIEHLLQLQKSLGHG